MSNLGRKTLSDLVVPLKFGISILKNPKLQIFTLSAGSEHLFHISMEADKCTFLGLRQRRTSTSDSIGPPTASDFNFRQHRTSDSVGLQPPTASDLRQRRTSSPTASEFYLRQRRTSISDSGGLLSPTASDFISDSVRQDYNLRQRRTSISNS